MKSWFNHIYLVNLYDAIKLSQSTATLKKALNEVVIDHLPLNCEDEGIKRLFSLVDFKPDRGAASFLSLKSALFTWVLHHSWGPGSYDSTRLEALFALSAVEGGFSELDRLFKYMGKVTLTEVVKRTEVLFDPSDKGLHGRACYRCHLGVTALDLQNMAGRRDSVAMASSLERLIPLVIRQVDAQSERFNRLQGLGIDSTEYKAESKLKRAKPTDIYIELNGAQVVWAKIPNRNMGEAFEVDWVNAYLGDNISVMKSLAAGLPKNIGRKVRAQFLEDELGM